MKKVFSSIKNAFRKAGSAVWTFLRGLPEKNKGLLVALISVGVFILLMILKAIPAVCEWWTRTIARALNVCLIAINSVIPFSVYEWLVALTIIFAVTVIVVFIVKAVKKRLKTFVPFLSWTLAVLFIFLNFYTVTTSFAYNRNELPIMSYSVSKDGALTLEEYTEMCQILTDEINELAPKMQRENGSLVLPVSRNELIDIIRNDMEVLNDFDGYYLSSTGQVKNPVFSRVFAEMGILGVYFAPVGEANVSSLTAPLDLPKTIAHELSHSKGVMRENEANLSAYYVILRSENDFVRYSGLSLIYFNVLGGLVSYYDGGTELYKDFVNNKVSKDFINDYNERFEYYAQFKLLRNVSNFLNDIYLKLQGQSQGNQSYNDKKGQTTTKPDPSDPTGQTQIRVITRYSDVQTIYIDLLSLKRK